MVSHIFAEEVGEDWWYVDRLWPMIFVKLPDGIHQIIFEGFVKKGSPSGILMDDLIIAPCSKFSKYITIVRSMLLLDLLVTQTRIFIEFCCKEMSQVSLTRRLSNA